MTSGDALELIASLVAALKTYASKLPAVVHRSVAPQGMKPTPEVVDAYETAVSRFRSQSGSSVYRKLNEHLIESLEAFEAGRLLSAIQPLLLAIDQLERMQQDKDIVVSPPDVKRMSEYRTALQKILPGKNPELEGAGRGMG